MSYFISELVNSPTPEEFLDTATKSVIFYFYKPPENCFVVLRVNNAFLKYNSLTKRCACWFKHNIYFQDRELFEALPINYGDNRSSSISDVFSTWYPLIESKVIGFTEVEVTIDMLFRPPIILCISALWSWAVHIFVSFSSICIDILDIHIFGYWK